MKDRSRQIAISIQYYAPAQTSKQTVRWTDREKDKQRQTAARIERKKQ